MIEQQHKNQERMAYSAQEVAEMLNVNRKTVYRLCQRNLLARSKALRTLRIPKWSVEQFLRETSK